MLKPLGRRVTPLPPLFDRKQRSLFRLLLAFIWTGITETDEFLGDGARAQSADVTSSLSSNELVILSFRVCLLALDSEK